jgi:hypothetical protein
LELCASIQVQCWLTVLCSETRPNAKPETVVRNLKEIRTQLKKRLIYISLLFLITSCFSVKKLDVNDIQPLSEIEILGKYEQHMRHYSVITLDSAKNFRYEFNTSFNQGYFVGNYSYTENHLTLNSDSLVSEKISDILAGNKIVSRSLDTTQFNFIVTEIGLHEKTNEGEYLKHPWFTKENSE